MRVDPGPDGQALPPVEQFVRVVHVIDVVLLENEGLEPALLVEDGKTLLLMLPQEAIRLVEREADGAVNHALPWCR